jgi:hypothetical protein
VERREERPTGNWRRPSDRARFFFWPVMEARAAAIACVDASTGPRPNPCSSRLGKLGAAARGVSALL